LFLARRGKSPCANALKAFCNAARGDGGDSKRAEEEAAPDALGAVPFTT
jgi:hypothetical protein